MTDMQTIAAGRSSAANKRERVGVALIGMGGAVATTAIAGIEMIKSGKNDRTGLPLAELAVSGLADYRDLVFTGWDVNADDLGVAAEKHGVLDRASLEAGAPGLRGIRPMQAVGSSKFCKNVDGENKFNARSHREAIERIADDLRERIAGGDIPAGGKLPSERELSERYGLDDYLEVKYLALGGIGA